jgi:hypothetical protein
MTIELMVGRLEYFHDSEEITTKRRNFGIVPETVLSMSPELQPSEICRQPYRANSSIAGCSRNWAQSQATLQAFLGLLFGP